MTVSESDKHMLAEIFNQPQAWAETIGIVEGKADRLREITSGAEEVVFTGCGSGLNAAEAIAPTFQLLTGIRSRAVPAAEVVFFPETVLVPGSRTVVVPLSRSGSTSETERAREKAQQMGMQTLGITCYPNSPLARRSTEALVLEPANEESVTTTQSLTSMVLCGQLLGGIASGNKEYLERLGELPRFGDLVMERFHDLGRTIGEDARIRKFAFVGTGSLRGLAREAQLKIKEMVLLPSDAYPLLDYRHGPKSNVDTTMLVTLLAADRTRQVEAEFLAEMKTLGGKLLIVCDRAGADAVAIADHVAEAKSGLPDFSRDILYMPLIHFLAYYKSLAEGQSPSHPKNLTYWVQTAGLGERG